MAAKFDIYQHVTDQIIASIEAGTPAWRKPWTGDAGGIPFPRRSTGEFYRGINILMLWSEAAEKGFRSPYWFTYRQAQEAGGQVRKSEKSAIVVKYGTVDREDPETGEEKTIGYAKSYRVFNADQVEGFRNGQRMLVGKKYTKKARRREGGGFEGKHFVEGAWLNTLSQTQERYKTAVIEWAQAFGRS